MYSNLIKYSFNKTLDKIGTMSVNRKAKHLSNYIQAYAKEPFGSRRLIDLYKETLSGELRNQKNYFT